MNPVDVAVPTAARAAFVFDVLLGGALVTPRFWIGSADDDGPPGDFRNRPRGRRLAPAPSATFGDGKAFLVEAVLANMFLCTGIMIIKSRRFLGTGTVFSGKSN